MNGEIDNDRIDRCLPDLKVQRGQAALQRSVSYFELLPRAFLSQFGWNASSLCR